MGPEGIKKILKKCYAFSDLDDQELSALASIGVPEVFRKGEDVFTINHEGKKFYVVDAGRLTLRLKNNRSKEYIQGELFGEVAILGGSLRFGTIRATEESFLASFNREDLFFSDKISKELALKVTLLLTRKVVSYFDNDELLCSEKMIEKGECDFIEFKRSLNAYNKSDIVRSIASFMNLNGGTIFCGVSDEDGQIVGIANNQSFDQLQKMLGSEIRNRLGLSFCSDISYDMESIKGKRVIRIDCNSARSPVFYKEYHENGELREYFIVRSGSENITMKRTSEVISYVQERFKNK